MCFCACGCVFVDVCVCRSPNLLKSARNPFQLPTRRRPPSLRSQLLVHPAQPLARQAAAAGAPCCSRWRPMAGCDFSLLNYPTAYLKAELGELKDIKDFTRLDTAVKTALSYGWPQWETPGTGGHLPRTPGLLSFEDTNFKPSAAIQGQGHSVGRCASPRGRAARGARWREGRAGARGALRGVWLPWRPCLSGRSRWRAKHFCTGKGASTSGLWHPESERL